MPSQATSRNLWPVGIIVAFAIFIAGTAGLIVMAWSQKSDLVSRDYYEQELKFQSQIERLDRARDLGAQASVTYDVAQQRIILSLPVEHALRKAKGRIHLYRPSAARLDRQLKLELNSAGVQDLDASELRPGLWRVRVFWTMGNQEFYLDRSVVIGSKAS